MANEAKASVNLVIDKGNMNYRSTPTDFQVSVTTAKGPSPGAITATVAGVDVDLSELASPGLCRIRNLDATNFVMVGLWDGTEFYPLFDLGPGEHYLIKLSLYLGYSFGVGTGTTDAGHTLRIKADTASCVVVVEAFDR